MMTPEEHKIRATIDLLEAQRPTLGDAVVDEAIRALQLRLTGPEATPPVRTTSSAMSMEGERKLVTIMFADISNFTSMSDSMDAEDVRTIMNNCFSRLVPIIEKYGGHVDKFIGDEIMALFGAPVAHDNDAEFALRAAIEMMGALKEFNGEHNTNLDLHFGINTGLVVAGGVGSTQLRQYSVIGDPVNLAARLEDTSLTGEILVGHDTFRLTHSVFDFEAKAPISVKGKKIPIQSYRLIGLKATPQSARGFDGMQSEMIGREEPYRALRGAVENLKQAQGQVISILAEPGIGKSRMLQEVRKSANDTPWLEGRGLFFEQSNSYALAKSILDQALGISSSISLGEVGDSLLEFIIRKNPVRINELYPYLALMRGIPLDERTLALHRAIPPEVMQLRIRQALTDFLSLYADGKPMVVVCEDVHWADHSSLQWIEFMISAVKHTSILVLITFRPKEGVVQQYHQRWIEKYPGYHAILLESLSDTESMRLVENLLRIKDLPPTTRSAILRKAEGNPFYVEELLKSLIDIGILVWQRGYFNLKHEIDQVKIPNTVQGVIEGRLDRLRSAEKLTLQAASVIGRIFGQEMLDYLMERERTRIPVSQTLSSLQETDLIRSYQFLEYIFRHTVTQDVAYNSLLLARRRELHQLVAEAMEGVQSGQTEEFSDALAWHYRHAGDSKNAIKYLVLAGDRSRKKFANQEAADYYTLALREIEKAKETVWATKVTVLENLGEVLVTLNRYDEARASYAEAIAIMASDQAIWRARLLRKTGESFAPQRRPDQELIQYELAITALGEDREPIGAWNAEWLDIELGRIWSYYWLNRVADMNARLKAIQPVCDEYGSLRQKSLWNGRHMLLLFRTERYAIQQSHLVFAERALALSTEAKDPQLILLHSSILGTALYLAGEMEKAERQLLLAIEFAQEVGDVAIEVPCLQFLNLVYMHGNNVARLTRYTRIMEEKAAGKVPFYLFSVKAFDAWLAWKRNDLPEVERFGLEALKIQGPAPVPNGFVKWPLAAAYVQQQRYPEAIAQLKDILLPYQIKTEEAVADLIQKVVSQWENGQTESAIEGLSKIMGVSHRFGTYGYPSS